MNKGFLALVLHAHLPYVRHPEYDSFFEENWLFEAITECYIPLLRVLERLELDRVNYRLTLSLSPTLITLLQDDLLQARYLKYLDKLLELSGKEIARTRHQAGFAPLARLYRRFYRDTRAIYQDQYGCDLLSAFKKFHATGHLELITCAATHGFLPLLSVHQTAVRNQIKIGVDTFKATFGFAPGGFWLPECAYYPGLEQWLAECGIGYFFVDSHGITSASAVPHNGVYAPLKCSNGILAFGRDPESSRQVWSAQEGYPGDFDYREYYRDIGFDAELDYIAPYILDGHIRTNTGIKYFRITGTDDQKQSYQPRKAAEKARLHARDFVDKRQLQLQKLSAGMDRVPLVVAPFDAELFGHWWFEGPIWLESVLRLADQPDSVIQTVSCSDYLQAVPTHQQATPSASSWGDQGYFSFWLNETNDWIYPLLHKACDELEQLVVDLEGLALSPLQVRALNQAVRCLLLAQASDWAFILKSGTAVEYAKKRVTDHLARFNYLHDSIRKNRLNERYVSALEIMDAIFPEVDYRDYLPVR